MKEYKKIKGNDEKIRNNSTRNNLKYYNSSSNGKQKLNNNKKYKNKRPITSNIFFKDFLKKQETERIKTTNDFDIEKYIEYELKLKDNFDNKENDN